MSTVTFRQTVNRNKISWACALAELLHWGGKDLVTSGEELELGEAAPSAPWTPSGAPKKSDEWQQWMTLLEAQRTLCWPDMLSGGCAASQECHWETAKPCAAHWLLPAADFPMGISGTARKSLRSVERHYRALGAALRCSGAEASFYISPLSQKEGVWKSHFIKKRSIGILGTQGAQFFQP